MSAWLEFEKLAAQIYSELQPQARVTHNDKILGRNTGIERQIDVSIRANVAGHDLLIIVQAKDYNRRADINVVGEFASVVDDVRASKGVLVCRSGFTEDAQKYARNLGIDLCNLHDAESRKWALDIKLPLLWIDYLPELDIHFEAYFEAGDSLSQNPQEWIFSANGGKSRILLFDTFEKNWNAGRLDRTVGVTHTISLAQQGIQLLVDNGNWRSVNFLVLRYEVSRKAWLGYFSPKECRGILNLLEDSFRASYFNIGEVPLIRDESWQPIDDPDKLAIDTKGTLITTEGWQILSDGRKYNIHL
jgi:phosphoribosylanthranilate isomerase